MSTLIEQLIRGYQIQDQYGSVRTELSPLQSIVNKYIEDNKSKVALELSKTLDKKEYLSEAIKEKIDNDFKNEYSRKRYEELFLSGIKDKIEQEIVKDLKVLLEGKKITVEIN